MVAIYKILKNSDLIKNTNKSNPMKTNITITNQNGLFLTNDGYRSYCFTDNEELAETFKDIECAEKLKAKLWNFKGLTINAPENLIEVE